MLFVLQCDVLVVGAGASGLAAARRLTDFGLKVRGEKSCRVHAGPENQEGSGAPSAPSLHRVSKWRNCICMFLISDCAFEFKSAMYINVISWEVLCTFGERESDRERLCCLTSTEESRRIRGGDEWEKGDRRAKLQNRCQPRRPRLPWTAARTTGC